tara:strand:- start:904 stop:2043 length:1140 start_codon:yes stop_codon:yes gene_type:complete
MHRIAAVVAGLSLAFVGTSATFAGTINVPGDYTLIQDAINASSDGDVINIAAGTYYEHSLNPSGKAITIQGTLNGDGSLATTIDAEQGGSVFNINSGEGNETVIQHLVITGGSGFEQDEFTYGGGICCFPNSIATISGCTISENTANAGGGIYSSTNSNLTISSCTIKGNTASSHGGGIHHSRCSSTINGCTISDNESADAGGGIFCFQSSLNISSCKIEANAALAYNQEGGDLVSGGGIFCFGTDATITNCTIEGNSSYFAGDGIRCEFSSNATISGGSVCGSGPSPTYADNSSNITSGLCWIDESCDGNLYIVIANQQEQIDQLLTMHAQQQSAIEDLQQVITACCAEQSCAGDENNDGVVDIHDLLIVISSWGACP